MKISRKKFLKLGSILAVSPLFIWSGINCSSKDYLTDPIDKPASDQFSSIMYNQGKYEIRNPSLKKGESYLIPYSSIVGDDNHGYVIRIRFQNDKTMYQSVHVRIIKKVDSSAWVTNLDESDILLIDPRKSLTELKKMNKKELKARFLPVKSLPEWGK